MVRTLSEALEIIQAQEQQIARQAQQIERLQEQVNTLSEALKSAQTTITRQQHQINRYIDRIYGRSSERHDPDQLSFELMFPGGVGEQDKSPSPVPERDDPSPRAVARPKKRRRSHGRLPIPDHLEREIIELDVPEEERICPQTGQPMIRIGYDDTEKLEYTPGRVMVKVYRRWKYASPDRSQGYKVGIRTAPLPDHPIPRCKAECGLVAYAIVSKFADHLPFYRQDDIFRREGLSIPRSTLDGWALQAGEVLGLLGDALKSAVLDTDVLFTDDTVIPLLEKGRGRTRKARMWVYVRGGTGPPLVAYDFTRDRRRERPLEYLKGFTGYVHADAYSGYDELFSQPQITEVGCWTHARRKFHEALTVQPERASEVLVRIQKVYRWEEQFRQLSPAERHAARLEKVRPILDSLLGRVEQIWQEVIPSDPLRKACDYVLNQREALRRFLDDGRLEPDNNTAENAIRPLAIGRNYAQRRIMLSEHGADALN